jgi:hypothetical protein
MYIMYSCFQTRTYFAQHSKVPSRLMLHNPRRSFLEKVSTTARTESMPEIGNPCQDWLRYPQDGMAIAARMVWTPR